MDFEMLAWEKRKSEEALGRRAVRQAVAEGAASERFCDVWWTC